MEPTDSSGQRNLANALFDTGDPNGAVAHAEIAVRLRPDDPGAHDVLGRALAVLGRVVDAERAFERALDVDPSHAEAREHLEAIRRLRAHLRTGAP